MAVQSFIMACRIPMAMHRLANEALEHRTDVPRGEPMPSAHWLKGFVNRWIIHGQCEC
jgi:hypothetical protein